MKVNYLKMMPSPEDGKRWLAEITDEDPTFRLKRDFQPEIKDGVWDIYDGWYQVHGHVANITPFHKEYVLVRDGKMQRRLDSRYMMAHLNDIKAFDNKRLERIKYQIKLELDDIYKQAPYEAVLLAMERQSDDLDLIENSSQALAGLSQLRKQKDYIIKQFQTNFQNQTTWTQ